jgi:hypothetical protein
MKPQSILNAVLLLIAIVFCFLYLNERPAAAKWNMLKEKSADFRNRKKADSVTLRTTLRTNLSKFNLRPEDTSLPFQDDRLAKLYIKHFNDDTANINKFFANRGMQPITSQVWMDAGTLSDLARIVTENNYDGLRMYFAKYPNLQANPDPQRSAHPEDNGKYNEKFTLVVVTTKAGTSGNHVDTYTDPSTGELEGLVNYHDICPPTCSSSTSTVLEQP